MKLPILETLAVVRDVTEPQRAWADIVALCRAAAPDAPWDSIAVPDLDRDILAATEWLDRELGTMPETRGVYLGLDTLNMQNGQGTNVEIGGSSDCDPLSNSFDWMFAGNLTYGSNHLIRGLYELQEVYSSPAWAAAHRVCDYIFFLGYSGVVLAESFARLDTPRTLLPAWGFHDGDLFALGRKQGGGFTRQCK